MLGLTSFAVSFAVSALLTPLVIWLAHRKGWVSQPRADRWHSRTTALMGGLAIFAGTAVAWLVAGDSPVVRALALPAVVMFVLGVIDDRVYELRPHHKLIVQVMAATMLFMSGFRFEAISPFLALPLTLLWVVGITNAVNLLDNMDGLAAGVTTIAALAIAACCSFAGNGQVAPALLGLAGGCAGFLLYNFNPARIFMGDCGSLFIGFSIAALSLQIPRQAGAGANDLVAVLVPISILAVPIFDTTLVAMARALHGRPILPGFRDHVSHRLSGLGLSDRSTVLVLYALTAIFCGFGISATRLPLVTLLPFSALLVGSLMALGFYLGFFKVYEEDVRVPAHVKLLGRAVLHKEHLVYVTADALLVPAAFVGAFALRFEGEILAWIAAGMLQALPLVLVAKVLGLALCGGYRGSWRWAGMTDALRAAAGSTVGSLLAIGLISVTIGLHNVSRAALIIDWLLFTVLAIGVRTAYAALRHIFAMLPSRNAARVVILGAGAEGVGLVLKLRDPFSPERATVVGILDDDPNKQHRTLNGVPVLGPIAALPVILSKGDVTCCLLGMSPYSLEGERILAMCRRHDIPVHTDLGQPPVKLRESPVLTPACEEEIIIVPAFERQVA